MAITNAPVMGSDGHAPIYDPHGRWTTWNKKELYLGLEGLNKYVGKIGDWVQDTDTFQVFEITSIDPLTLIPQLNELDVYGKGQLDLIGSTTADTFRVFLDTSVTPHILAADARLLIPGSMNTYIKMFKGGDVGPNGKVISFLFDQQGRYLTDKIPLELASIDSHTNHTFKTITVCHTKEKLKDGERVMIVVYNDQGHVTDKKAVIVENTSFIRHIAQGTKYISHISIDSPFLSSSNANVLEYPINVPLQAFNMHGIVHYSDGSQVKLPIDGGKFSVLGLEKFVATVPGQDIKLVLSYKLDPTETAYGAVSSDGKYITSPLSLKVTKQDGAYTVKLYGYPVWVPSESGYRMRWFLMDLNRDVLFDVTPYVYYNQNSDVFDPQGYDKIQNLSVRINLKDVSKGMKSYIHTQTMAVVLKTPGDSDESNWMVAFQPNQQPLYGVNLKAKVEMINQNLWKVNVKNDLPHLNAWLDKLYLDTKPLIDIQKEIAPPTPTHMVFVYGTSRTEYEIQHWDKDMQVNGELQVHGTLQIEFIKRTNTGDIRLAIAGLPIKAM